MIHGSSKKRVFLGFCILICELGGEHIPFAASLALPQVVWGYMTATSEGFDALGEK